MRGRGLHQEQGSEDVDGVHAVKLAGGNGAQRRVVEVLVGRHAGVVDEDIDLEPAGLVVAREEGPGGGHDSRCRLTRIRQVRLHGGAPDAVPSREARDEVLRTSPGRFGRVRREDIGTLGSQPSHHGLPDSYPTQHVRLVPTRE